MVIKLTSFCRIKNYVNEYVDEILEEVKNLEWNFRDWNILLNILSSSINIDCLASPAIIDTAKSISGSCRHFVLPKS